MRKHKILSVIICISLVITGMIFSSDAYALAEGVDEIPEEVLNARSGVVHVYLLFYDNEGRLIAFNSGAGIMTAGATLVDDSFPDNWNCVLTSLGSVDPTKMTVGYGSYKIVVVADGEVYSVKDVAGLPDKNQDLALLIMNERIQNRNAIGLEQIKHLKEGEAVYALGFPEPSDPYVPGYESYENEESIETGEILELNHVDTGVTYIQSNLRTRRNIIGGALVNSDGHLVGMISSYNGTKGNLAITCDDIFDFLDTANMPIALAPEYDFPDTANTVPLK